jgi:hypothetical protein
MATYNWAYRPGVTNKYNFVVAGTDDTLPSTINGTTCFYVALFGNDTTGNGSRQYPYKTIIHALKAVNFSTKYIILGSGVYRESFPDKFFGGGSVAITSNAIFIGDGDVRVDASFVNTPGVATTFTFDMSIGGTYNIEWTGAQYLTGGGGDQVHSIFDSKFTKIQPNALGDMSNTTLSGCILTGDGTTLNKWSGLLNRQFESTTFVDCMFNMNSSALSAAWLPTGINACIFDNCTFDFSALHTGVTVNFFNYCVFNNCTFKFLGDSALASYANIAALQAKCTTVFGAGSYFNNCIQTDPLFNNRSIGDYTLSFTSPARNASYLGAYAGARSIAYQVKASATESTGTFDFATNVNLTVANDSITLVDPTQNAEIKTKLIVNTTGRQIQRFPLYGLNSDRNGQYIDSIPDLNVSTVAAGATLTIPTPYLVETASITYNSNVYAPGDRFTTVTGQTTFATSGGGVLREILEAPERHTIMMLVTDGHGTVAASSTLIVGDWYYVESGSVTWNTNTYMAGQFFKATITTGFTGSGVVTHAVQMTSDIFCHYEPGIQPTTNNVGDVRTGAIVRGNGDPAYVRGGYGVTEWPVSSRFIILYYLIKVSNLKP